MPAPEFALLMQGLLGLVFLITAMAVVKDAKNQTDNPPATEQRDLNFNNTVYLCENNACDHQFFRLYQVMAAYNLGHMHIPGETRIYELDYSQAIGLELFEQLGLVRCPGCHEKHVAQAKQFEWMDDAPAFPKFTSQQLAEHRIKIENPTEKKRLDDVLDDIESQIHKIDGIAAYQLQYGYSQKDETEITDALKKIREQLSLMSVSTHHVDIRNRAAKMAKNLELSSNERFIKHVSEPEIEITNDERVQVKWERELTKTIHTLRFRTRQIREEIANNGGNDTDEYYQIEEIDVLANKYIEMTQRKTEN